MVGEHLGVIKDWRPNCPGCTRREGKPYRACAVKATLKEESYADGAYCGHVFYTSPEPEGSTRRIKESR